MTGISAGPGQDGDCLPVRAPQRMAATTHRVIEAYEHLQTLGTTARGGSHYAAVISSARGGSHYCSD